MQRSVAKFIASIATPCITRTAAPAMVESLEERRMLSAAPAALSGGAALRGHALIVTGTAAADTILISRDARRNDMLKVSINGSVSRFRATKVRGISVLAGAGDDTVRIDDSNGVVAHAHVSGEAGDDSIIGGNAGDTLEGDAGDDSLIGGSRNDTLLGGDNNDTLEGASGDDSLNGGLGNDSLLGDRGNDTEVGDAGDDTLLGGSGNDDLNGDANNDSLDGGIGDDSLDGGTGTDQVHGGDGHDHFNTTDDNGQINDDGSDDSNDDNGGDIVRSSGISSVSHGNGKDDVLAFTRSSGAAVFAG